MPLQATSGAASYDGFGGGVPFTPTYIEEIFSTTLYTGNGSTQTITNGIDLAGKGGLVWTKQRNGSSYTHTLADTVRGNTKYLYTSATDAEETVSTRITAFGSTGYDLGANLAVNGSANTYASWTFREQAKFFDVVTYTGNGTARTISHSLGSVPGCIIVKRTDSAESWYVYHRSIGAGGRGILNSTDAFSTSGATNWNNTEPTSTQFSLGASSTVNANGGTYVAYLFAHDAGGFGLTGTDNVISCGSFTTDGSGNATVSLGYEPQWLLIKATGNSQNWILVDVMRGMALSPPNNALFPNTSGAEYVYDPVIAYPTATGFYINGASGALFNSASYIYIAIRRGPMKTPTSGTSVFYPQTVTQADTPDSTGVPFPPDLVNTFSRNGTNRSNVYDLFTFADRLRGLGSPNNTYSSSGPGLISSSSNAEVAASPGGVYVQLKADSQNITRGGGWNSALYGNWIYYFMRRAPGFFDVACWTATVSTDDRTQHNLGVAPEMIILKSREVVGQWVVYHAALGNNRSLYFTSGAAQTYSPTWTNVNSTSFGFNNADFGPNGNSVAYLFASCPGVSKVGSYTGTGALQTINCGFTGGARFVLIKRTDSTGDWFVYDSARGISSGNDPYLLLNSTAAEVTGTNYVDTTSVGFQVTAAAPAELNANGGTYIFLAIA